MKIFVIGATGATGQQIVERGLTQGHTITALVRNPDKFEMQHESLHVVKGDILDRVSLDAVQQQDAVISSLGTRKISLESVTLLSEGTKNLVRVMEQHGVNRLICITGLGAGGVIKSGILS